MKKIPLVVLFGPTASGKTELAVQICKRFRGEVVTADSMQVYRYMDIGTAKPDEEERQGIAHHMIDVADPKEAYNLARYIKDAKKVIEDVWSRGKLPVLAGGTGLYIDTLVDNIILSDFENDLSYRKSLYDLAEKEGSSAVHSLLEKVDPESAERLHVQDLKRVVRALEVYRATGITQSEQIRRSKAEPSPYYAVKFGIVADRQELYSRINRRVDRMFQRGLVEEVEALKRMGVTEEDTSMQGLGYKEVLWYLDGKISLPDCIDRIKQYTRRYAKRQISWFKREEHTAWLNLGEPQMPRIEKQIMEELQPF